MAEPCTIGRRSRRQASAARNLVAKLSAPSTTRSTDANELRAALSGKSRDLNELDAASLQKPAERSARFAASKFGFTDVVLREERLSMKIRHVDEVVIGEHETPDAGVHERTRDGAAEPADTDDEHTRLGEPFFITL